MAGPLRERAPVRLRVSYRSTESLLAEFSRSVGRGSTTIESEHSVAKGTNFIFELTAPGLGEPVEVIGVIRQASKLPSGRYLLSVGYRPGAKRRGLAEVAERLARAHEGDAKRKFARIPLKIRATEDGPASPPYLIRDLSVSGVGLEVETKTLPEQIRVGTPFWLELSLPLGPLSVHGEVLWVLAPSARAHRLIRPSFGVGFGKLRGVSERRLERLLSLAELPPAPWSARISFGSNAVARMPGMHR